MKATTKKNSKKMSVKKTKEATAPKKTGQWKSTKGQKAK